MRTQLNAIAAAATVGMLVGATMVSTKVVSSAVSPATLAFLRYLIGAAFLLLPIGAATRTRFTIKDAAAIAVLGIFQFAVLVLLLNYALLTVSATLCALVFSTMPLVTMCLAVVTGKEAYRSRGMVGVCTAVAGVAYLLLRFRTCWRRSWLVIEGLGRAEHVEQCLHQRHCRERLNSSFCRLCRLREERWLG